MRFLLGGRISLYQRGKILDATMRCDLLKITGKQAIKSKNLSEVLMDALRCCSPEQITNVLFEVLGQQPAENVI